MTTSKIMRTALIAAAATAALSQAKQIQDAVDKLGATRADIPGLWNVPGYAELTTNQLLQIAGKDQ